MLPDIGRETTDYADMYG